MGIAVIFNTFLESSEYFSLVTLLLHFQSYIVLHSVSLVPQLALILSMQQVYQSALYL